MNATFFVLGIGLLVHCPMMAQTQASDVIRIKGGVGAEKTVPYSFRYRYDRFLDGKLLYQNNTVAETRLNYNVLLGEMQFIDAKGDTLSLANEPVIRMVSVGTDVFWVDQGKTYYEIIADYATLKLAIKQGLKVAKPDKLAGYGQSSGSSAITNYQFYSSGTASVRTFDAKGDLVLIKSKTYFVIDQNRRAYPVNKSNLLKVLSKHRDQVTTYLENNAIDLTQEDDLKKLLQYCSGLL